MWSARSSGDIGAAIRAERRQRGWSQAELARRAGVSRQWLIEVEQGHDRAEAGKVISVLEAVGGRVFIETSARAAANASTTWMTAADTARAIRAELERGDRDFALRMLRRGVSDFAELTTEDERAAYLERPPSTGDHRWDTLLAAAVSRTCRRHGVRAPAWTRVEPLRSWWFPNGDTIRQARTMQLTPIDLANKGIWLDARALDAV